MNAEELRDLAGRLPAYIRLAWALARDPRIPRFRKILLAGGALYGLSPVDLIPGFLPVVGQLDDAAALLGALRRALGALPGAERRAHLARVGLDEATLAADQDRVRAALKATARAAVGGVWRGARWTARTSWRLTRAAARTAGRVASRSAGRARGRPAGS